MRRPVACGSRVTSVLLMTIARVPSTAGHEEEGGREEGYTHVDADGLARLAQDGQRQAARRGRAAVAAATGRVSVAAGQSADRGRSVGQRQQCGRRSAVATSTSSAQATSQEAS